MCTPTPGPTKAQANVEHELVSKALTRVKELEERKRKAEEDFEQEMIQKKQRVQKQIEELIEQRNVEESRLALASEQLQQPASNSICAEQHALQTFQWTGKLGTEFAFDNFSSSLLALSKN
jgi:DNA-binding protein H-NS